MKRIDISHESFFILSALHFSFSNSNHSSDLFRSTMFRASTVYDALRILEIQEITITRLTESSPTYVINDLLSEEILTRFPVDPFLNVINALTLSVGLDPLEMVSSFKPHLFQEDPLLSGIPLTPVVGQRYELAHGVFLDCVQSDTNIVRYIKVDFLQLTDEERNRNQSAIESSLKRSHSDLLTATQAVITQNAKIVNLRAQIADLEDQVIKDERMGK